jgi:hypothetical protein
MFGPGMQIDQNSGAGNATNHVVVIGRLAADLVWPPPPASGAGDQAFGYFASALLVPTGRTLTVPAGTTARFGTLFVDGGRVVSGGAGTRWTGLDDNDFGRIDIGRAPDGTMGSVSVTDAAVRAVTRVDGRGGPVDTTAVRAERTNFEQGFLEARHARIELRGVTTNRASELVPTELFLDEGSELTAVGADLDEVAINLFGSTATLSGVRIRGVFIGDPPPPGLSSGSPGLSVLGSTVSITCSTFTHNLNGIGVGANSTVTIRNSRLHGNNQRNGDGRYDLSAQSAVDARQNWWGRPGGPRAGQVSDVPGPADTREPLAAAPACAPPSITSQHRPIEPTNPRQLDFACPPGRASDPGFVDTAGNTHRRAIDCITGHGIARGTGPGRYTPDAPVTRAQMATFIARFVALTGRPLPAGPDAFDDDTGSTHEAAINALAAAGIANGVSDRRFEPDQPVNRGQMAAFISRAIVAITAVPLVNMDDDVRFDDAAPPAFAPHVDALAERGIVAGRAARFYDVGATVRRDQTATFVARALDLLVEHPTANP